jgi:hypothetical protein
VHKEQLTRALVVGGKPVVPRMDPSFCAAKKTFRWLVEVTPEQTDLLEKPKVISAASKFGKRTCKGGVDVVWQSPALLPAEKLAWSLICALDQTDVPGYHLQDMGAYFVGLPVLLGRNKALDSAVECYLHAHALMLQGRTQKFSSKELRLYGRAISTLRDEMMEPGAKTSSETLAAAIMLVQYEFLKHSDEYAIIKMAGGVAAIFEAWGPARIASEFEVRLLATQFPSIITHAIILGKDCFLDNKQWHAAMRKYASIQPVMIELWIVLSALPKFLLELRRLLNSPVGAHRESLQHRACFLRECVLAQERNILRELSSPAVAKVAPALYTGVNPVAPSDQVQVRMARCAVRRAAFYWACIIFVNIALERLEMTSSTIALQTAEAASSIMSTLSVAASIKPLGAAFVTLCGPAAYGVVAEWSQRQYIQTSVSDMLEELKVDYSHAALQRIFDAFTGGPI